MLTIDIPTLGNEHQEKRHLGKLVYDVPDHFTWRVRVSTDSKRAATGTTLTVDGAKHLHIEGSSHCKNLVYFGEWIVEKVRLGAISVDTCRDDLRGMLQNIITQGYKGTIEAYTVDDTDGIFRYAERIVIQRPNTSVLYTRNPALKAELAVPTLTLVERLREQSYPSQQ